MHLERTRQPIPHRLDRRHRAIARRDQRGRLYPAAHASRGWHGLWPLVRRCLIGARRFCCRGRGRGRVFGQTIAAQVCYRQGSGGPRRLCRKDAVSCVSLFHGYHRRAGVRCWSPMSSGVVVRPLEDTRSSFHCDGYATSLFLVCRVAAGLWRILIPVAVP